MHIVFILLAFCSSALAYSVLIPNTDQGGPTKASSRILEWQRVGTDRLNFSVVLINQDKSNFTPQLLGNVVDGTVGKTGCNPPQGGWPTGSGFRVNFVESATALNSILAQSNTFNITQSTASATETASGIASTSTIAATKSAADSNLSIQSGFLLVLGFLLSQGSALA
ncbi:GPI-anchored small secreted protein [Pholiota molesta]|nr:GPI-anchored small secreted protein [Pholiota molesta]